MRALDRLFLAAMLVGVAGHVNAQVNVDEFIKKDSFRDISLSPTGEYYAATVPDVGKTFLVIMRRSDNKVTGTFALGKNTHVEAFEWVNNERILISTSEKFGQLDEPLWTGELYAISADGSKAELLVGARAQGDKLGSNIRSKKSEMVAAFVVDSLPGDDDNVLVSISPFDEDPFTRVDKMDVYSGRRVPIARAPVRRASFVTDNAGQVRFALGAGIDNINKLYYLDVGSSDWKLINDEAVTDRIEVPIGFSADDRTAYLTVQQTQGPDAIVAMDIATGARKEVLRDDDTDPTRILHRPGTSIPVGAWYMDGKPRTAFFDPAGPEARLYRSLEAAFPEEAPYITSTTTDGKLTLVRTFSDRNPGDFYVFDNVAKKADHLISRRGWFDPAKMAEMRPVAFNARDKLPLKGYVTLPNGSAGKNLPMVVLPHGGPYGIHDAWGFEDESQILAAAGYAVLQVNFRGSGNQGRAFQKGGAKEWGGKMQDDLTDATRWAIQQGIADPARVCIYGASYGGYAALMGVAKEPDLYKCAVGYVGVYDLPIMQATDSRYSRSLGNWSKEWVGEPDQLGSVSPNRIADRIKVPVFLAAGGEDNTAPIEHSRKMERALIGAGVPVETLYFDTEGHGFYTDAHRRQFYTQLLAFLSRNIGGATAKPGVVAAGK